MKSSYHVHSSWSDGRGSIPDILAAAKKFGLDEVGISDHFAFAPDDTQYAWAMLNSDLDKYVSYIEKVSHDSLIFRLGLEADFFPQTVEKLDKILRKKPFDYVLGSVHVVLGKVIDSIRNPLPMEEAKKLLREYWKLVRQMAESKTFDIVAHIDLPKKFLAFPPLDVTHEIDDALEAIAQSGMTVELNTSGWYVPCREQYPSKEILIKCKKLNIPVMVNADSHAPDTLIRGYNDAYKILREIGFEEVVYYIQREKHFSPLPISI